MRSEAVNNINDEISLYDLFYMLWQQKWVILMITALSIIFCATYLVFAKPVYEAKAIIVSPTLADLQLINAGRSNVTLLIPKQPEKVYQVFIDTLNSESLKQIFFNQVYLSSLGMAQKTLNSKDKFYATFLKNIIIKPFAGSTPNQYIVSFRANNQDNAYDWLVQYVAMAKQQAQNVIAKELINENELMAQTFKQKIEMANTFAQQSKSDRLVLLNEALAIAKAAGIKTPIANSVASVETVATMYLRGSNALEAEIKMLQSRKDDAPFIENLRNLQAEYQIYNNFQLVTNKPVMFNLDGDIMRPAIPILPKPLLFLVLSLIGGLIGGALIAFLRAGFNKNA